MSREHRIFVGLAVVVICAGLPFITRAPKPDHTIKATGPSQVLGMSVINSLPSIKPKSQIKEEVRLVSAQVVHKYVKPFKSMPTPKEYRSEVARDQHNTPRVLNGFAYEMAQEMSKAKQNVTQGVALFDKLRTCALSQGESTIEPVRAVCAQNAAELAQLYPSELKKNFSDLYASLDRHLKATLWR